MDELDGFAKSAMFNPRYFEWFLTKSAQIIVPNLTIWKDHNSQTESSAAYLAAADDAVNSLSNLASLLIRLRDHMAYSIQEYESTINLSGKLRSSPPDPGILIEKMKQLGWRPGKYDIFDPDWEPPSSGPAI